MERSDKTLNAVVLLLFILVEELCTKIRNENKGKGICTLRTPSFENARGFQIYNKRELETHICQSIFLYIINKNSHYSFMRLTYAWYKTSLDPLFL